MFLCKIFALFRKADKAQPKQAEPHKSKHHPVPPGQYWPRSKWVRIDNIATAAGVKMSDVREAALRMNIMVRKFTGEKGEFVNTVEAMAIHDRLSK